MMYIDVIYQIANKHTNYKGRKQGQILHIYVNLIDT